MPPICRRPPELQSNVIPVQFNAQRRQILERSLADESFRELWKDYCEVVARLKPIENEVVELRRLRAELEQEIGAALD